MQEEDDWLDWKVDQEMIENWIGLRQETYPHHHHDEHGNVRPSRLTGNPVRDIEIVLHDVSVFIWK